MQVHNMKKAVWRISLVAAVLIITYLGLRAKEINKIIDQLDDQILRASTQLQEEQLILQELEDERSKMDTIEYIEKMAREKLGMVKENDIVFKEKKN